MKQLSIDIGTCCIHAAVFDGKYPQLLNSSITVNYNVIPSIAYIRDKRMIVGHEADIWSRFMPDYSYEQDVSQKQSSEYWRVVFGYILELAIEQFGKDGYDLIFITPNDFYEKDPRKRLIQEASLSAGFSCVKFRNRSYILCKQIKANDRARFLVCDYGHSMFKASLLQKDKDNITILGSNKGDSYIGLETDGLLRSIIEDKISIQYMDGIYGISQSREIDDLTIRIKESLSTLESVEYPVPFTNSICHVTRKEYEMKLQDLIYGTIKTCSSLLHDRGITWDSITHIVLSGGVSVTPFIEYMWKKHVSSFSAVNMIEIIKPSSSKSAMYDACLNAFEKETVYGNKNIAIEF